MKTRRPVVSSARTPAKTRTKPTTPPPAARVATAIVRRRLRSTSSDSASTPNRSWLFRSQRKVDFTVLKMRSNESTSTVVHSTPS
jgi:hypothetical protein